MVKIYGVLTPNVLKPLLVAEELSVNYEHVNVELVKGEHRTPEHRARHPFGLVPVLEHDGRFLWESNTICRYLGNFTENKLYPTGKWERAQVEQWIDFSSNHVGRNITGIFFQRCVAPVAFKRPTNEVLVTEFEKGLRTHMPMLEDHLSQNTYLTGKDFTLADIVLFSLASPYRTAKLDMSPYPSFEKWFDGIKQRPSVQRLIPLLPMPYIR